jgi:hypothetical protein
LERVIVGGLKIATGEIKGKNHYQGVTTGWLYTLGLRLDFLDGDEMLIQWSPPFAEVNKAGVENLCGTISSYETVRSRTNVKHEMYCLTELRPK